MMYAVIAATLCSVILAATAPSAARAYVYARRDGKRTRRPH